MNLLGSVWQVVRLHLLKCWKNLALDERVSARVAANLNTPLSLLEQLARASNQNIYALQAVARNPRTIADILDMLYYQSISRISIISRTVS